MQAFVAQRNTRMETAELNRLSSEEKAAARSAALVELVGILEPGIREIGIREASLYRRLASLADTIHVNEDFARRWVRLAHAHEAYRQVLALLSSIGGLEHGLTQP
jgi:hypothetical protein